MSQNKSDRNKSVVTVLQTIIFCCYFVADDNFKTDETYIKLAGGSPNPETFPIVDIQISLRLVLKVIPMVTRTLVSPEI